jgi:hypothetical protein
MGVLGLARVHRHGSYVDAVHDTTLSETLTLTRTAAPAQTVIGQMSHDDLLGKKRSGTRTAAGKRVIVTAGDGVESERIFPDN